MVNTIFSITAIIVMLVIAIRAGSNIRKVAKKEKDLYLKSHYDRERQKRWRDRNKKS